MAQQYLVQFGSGKPGEMGSASTERALYESLNFKNPQILFIPFHHLIYDEVNDWTLFKEIYQPLTSKKIQLKELFDDTEKLASIPAAIKKADIIVLGSGVLEYFMVLIRKHGLLQNLQEEFHQGKHFFGYSAGSIALGSHFVHPLLLDEVKFYIDQMKASCQKLDGDEKAECLLSLRNDFLLQFSHAPSERVMLELFDSNEDYDSKGGVEGQVSGLKEKVFSDDPLEEPVVLDYFETDCFGFIPSQSVFPHFDEYLHCTSAHLRTASARHATVRFFGIPNGVALLHTYDGGYWKPQKSEVFGDREDCPVVEMRSDGFLHRYQMGETVGKLLHTVTDS